MNQTLNLSDINVILSDEEASSVIRSPSQASPSTRARPAPDRADRSRFIDGDLQTLRSIQLSLRRWGRPRPQAIPLYNRACRRASAARLRAERDLSASRGVSCQLPQTPGDAQRDLRDQCRASAPPRKSRLDGSGRRNSRFRRGGRHSRQHDRILSCWRRPAVQHGGNRS
jgi:hypothetical protein